MVGIRRMREHAPWAVEPVVHVEGAGPEEVQQAQAQRSFHSGLFAGAVRNGTLAGVGSTRTSADFRSPQVFVEHPRLVTLVDDAAVNVQTAAPSLPGRVPPPSWDGEPGYAAPETV